VPRPLAPLAAAGVVAAGLLVGAPAPAHAASTDFGKDCVVSDANAGTAVYTAKGASNPLPLGAPQTGVITKVRVTMPAFPGAFSVEVKAMRAAAAPNSYTVAAQSRTFNVTSGPQTVPVRVPVTAGDLLGTSGLAALYCTTGDAGDVIAQLPDVNAGVGTTATYTPSTGRAVPFVATVEPDADKDGYGDETQDLCPQSAAYQTPCPTAKIDSAATVAKNKITVLVATDLATSASATGTAKAGGKKVTLTGGPMTLTPGALTKLTVKVPGPLKKALAALPAKKSLKVTLTVSATNIVGAPTTDTVTVKLPGRAR
jgi:hypothetical protein